LSADFRLQGHPDDVEVGVVGPLDPVAEGVHLETFSGPVPGSLGFDDVEFVFDPEEHGGVTSVGAGTVFDDLIKTVQSGNGEEISGVDEGRIDVDDDVLGVSGFPLVAGDVSDELDVLVDLVFGGLRAEERDLGVEAESAEEEPKGLEEVGDVVDDLVAESEDVDSGVLDVLVEFGSEVLESDDVLAGSVNGFGVEVGQGGVHVTFTAETVSVVDFMDDFNGGLVDKVDADSVVLVAGSGEGFGLDRGVEASDETGEDLEEFGMITGNACLDVGGDFFVVEVVVLPGVAKLSKVFFFGEETTLRPEDDRGGFVVSVLLEVEAAELVRDLFEALVEILDG
jgi:hypothetical protein